MAFKLNGGRGSFQKTGRGIPQTLTSGSPTKQLVDATTGKTAKELAKDKLKNQMEQAGKNTGDSKNVRSFEASATATVPGKKVERPAKTPAEIKKWENAKAKAEKEGKPFGEQYKPKSETATVKASDTGSDKPAPEPKESNLSGKVYYSQNTNTKSGFGSNSTSGLTDNKDVLSAGKKKNAADTDKTNAALGKAFTTGELNKWKEVPQTKTEARLQSKNILNSGNYNPARVSDPKKSADFLNKALDREKVYDTKVAVRKEGQAKVKAKADAARAAVEAKKAAKAKSTEEKKATKKENPPVKQMKKIKK